MGKKRKQAQANRALNVALRQLFDACAGFCYAYASGAPDRGEKTGAAMTAVEAALRTADRATEVYVGRETKGLRGGLE